MEELKNIWQHVLRRKKFDPREQKNFDNLLGESGEVAEYFTGTGDFVYHGKLNRKRKDQNVNEDEKLDENGQLNEDSSSHKKPRVVLSRVAQKICCCS
jgi:two-component response regulator ARR-B family